MLQKQEGLAKVLNEQPVQVSTRGMQTPRPRKANEFAEQRKELGTLGADKLELQDQMRELNRQIPTLASDFQFEVEQISSNIETLTE